MKEPTPEDIGKDVDKDGNFVAPEDIREVEPILKIVEGLKIRILEELENDVESTIATVRDEFQGITEEQEYEFQVSSAVSTKVLLAVQAYKFLQEPDKVLAKASVHDRTPHFSIEELAFLRQIPNSPEAHSIYSTNEVKYVDSFVEISLKKDEVITNVSLRIHLKPKEESAELVHLRFSNTCAYCKNEVVVEESIPVSKAGKWKKGKGKDKGKEYRDWDFGEVDCSHCEVNGKPPKTFLYHREWREIQ